MTDFIFFFKIGWAHIISKEAIDHLYFIATLAIVYSFPEWRKIIVLITAFTIGHSITLFLSVLNLIRMNNSFVEFAIPCTIIFSAVFNLFGNTKNDVSGKIRYVMAFLFGLIHGMGFANAIRFMLSGDQGLGWSLFSFNIGLESGQIFVVLLILFLAWSTQKIKQYHHRKLVLLISSVVLVLSIKMALDRFPFFN